MVFHTLDSLYITFSFLLIKLYTAYGPFMTSLVFCLHCFSPFITLRLGFFLAPSLCFFSYNFIGSHHVIKISFSDSHYNASFLSIVYTHVTYLYIVFLQCETNLEGNIKGAPFKYRLQHNFEYVIQHNYARPQDFRGSQTLFSKTRNSYFFLLFPDVFWTSSRQHPYL